MLARVLGLLTLGLAPAIASAQPDGDAGDSDPEAHYRRGGELFEAGDYAGAAIESERCFELSGASKCLWGWAQAERLAGRCTAAQALYEKLRESAPVDAADSIDKAIASCVPAAGEEPPPALVEPKDELAPSLPPTADPATDGPADQKAWIADPVAGVGLSLGVLAGGASGVMWLRARRASIAAGDGRDLVTFESERAAAARDRRIAIGLAVGSGVLISAAIARYALVRSARQTGATASVVAVNGGWRVAIGGRF